ncbi:hypothetical protein [Acinetobacter ursingii]|uniref:hypothetical protein n=1 Tax=Acinetobacter ursingii TaxID=108980 RepID=UPI00124C8E8A|nr:hypothetical protein [Acinetobacter ursingii]
MSNQLNANELKDALWDSLKAVKAGQMQPAHADSIAGLSREILRTVKVQLQVSNQSKRSVPQDVLDFAENTDK